MATQRKNFKNVFVEDYWHDLKVIRYKWSLGASTKIAQINLIQVWGGEGRGFQCIFGKIFKKILVKNYLADLEIIWHK